MSAQIATQDERTKAEEKKRLALLLRRQIALQKDVLMDDASILVDEHFQGIARGNRLKAAQLKNLEGVAYSSPDPGGVVSFINKQAAKEKNERQAWTHKELHKNLQNKINQIVGRNPVSNAGDSGLKDEIMAEVKSKADDLSPVSEDVLNSWFSKELAQDIQMELLREFVSHFAIFYELKAKEILGQADEDE